MKKWTWIASQSVLSGLPDYLFSPMIRGREESIVFRDFVHFNTDPTSVHEFLRKSLWIHREYMRGWNVSQSFRVTNNIIMIHICKR